MVLIEELSGKKVFLDTSPFIYFIEKHSQFHDLVKPVISLIDQKKAIGLTSTLTLLEVLVQPLRVGDKKLAEKYKAILLASQNLVTYEISHGISERASLLRAEHNLRTPDAIQMATALYYQADYFFTNDPVFKKVKDIKVIILSNFG